MLRLVFQNVSRLGVHSLGCEKHVYAGPIPVGTRPLPRTTPVPKGLTEVDSASVCVRREFDCFFLVVGCFWFVVGPMEVNATVCHVISYKKTGS